MPQINTFRSISQGRVIVAYSLAVVFLLDAAQSAQFVDGRDVRIAADSLCAVSLCAYEIIEVVLCHTSVEPWLIKIRLGLYCLVEILNAQNIVFEIQR